MERLIEYFSDINEIQTKQFEMLLSLYEDWNSKINVISRKDMDAFYIHHVIHSLAYAKMDIFKSGHSVLDVGTGGGFPGIPLAIMYPEVHFTLMDSIEKKTKVVRAVAEELGLENVTVERMRMEEYKKPVDIVVSRAVAPALKLINQTRKCSHKTTFYAFLKGGDLSEEKSELKKYYPHKKWREMKLSQFFKEDFFETKKLIFIS
jgi:16S rRNA (guanine527-N7)-methyltransferase